MLDWIEIEKEITQNATLKYVALEFNPIDSLCKPNCDSTFGVLLYIQYDQSFQLQCIQSLQKYFTHH